MNRFVTAIKSLDLAQVEGLIRKEPKWTTWSDSDGRNALHYLCSVRTSSDAAADASLKILKLLEKAGMDLNSVHNIDEENCDAFPATPLWYAYTRGRNGKLFKYLLKKTDDPNNCWWSIAWYDDVPSAKLWLKHGAVISKRPSIDDLFFGAFQWKKIEFAKWALAEGADVNTRGPDGSTALLLAVKRKDDNSIKWLIANGADADLEDDNGNSARKIAKTKGPKRLLELIELK